MEVYGLHFCQADGVLFILLAVAGKEAKHGFFLHKRFDDTYARIAFLCIGGEVRKEGTILNDWATSKAHFVKVMPRDYKAVLLERKKKATLTMA